MKRIFKWTAAVLAVVLIMPLSGNFPVRTDSYVAAYAKAAVKLSKKSLSMTRPDKKYTLKLQNAAKKSQIRWEATIKARTAEGAEPCISMAVSADKKKVTITPLRDGSGTIVCTVNGRKLKCSYKVKFHVSVPSRFSDLADYLEINGTDVSGVRTKSFGQLEASGARCTVYGNFLGRDMAEFDISGSYVNTSDYFTVTFRLGSNGAVSDVIVTERVGHTDIYKATITSRSASAFKKGCKTVDFYTQLEPGASQYQSSCESMAQKNFDVALQCINTYLNQTLGFTLQNLGFTNYK